MIDFNQETVDAISKGFDVLIAIYEYNPSATINLSSLCLQTSYAKHNLETWPKTLIQDFLIKECQINTHKLNDVSEIINTLKDYYEIGCIFEAFCDSEEMFDILERGIDVDDINLDNIEEFPDVFSAFISFIRGNYNIHYTSISSSLLNSASEITKDFAYLLPYYLSEHLNLFTGYIMNYNFKFNEDNQTGTFTLYTDQSEDYMSVEDCFSGELESYIQIFLNNLKNIKERHSQN